MASGHRVQGFISLINDYASSQALDGLKGKDGGPFKINFQFLLQGKV